MTYFNIKFAITSTVLHVRNIKKINNSDIALDRNK